MTNHPNRAKFITVVARNSDFIYRAATVRRMDAYYTPENGGPVGRWSEDGKRYVLSKMTEGQFEQVARTFSQPDRN